ncbi:reticulon-4 isoform X2 [Zootoca vivipara]|uniref:reticulon-4 isoform X2 n=1 Tax=Zootoca vivipara TaxID=8524 RepID=UPI001591DC4A|nr:reticulon-4 isoform X2 [Zootoca vivipara]
MDDPDQSPLVSSTATSGGAGGQDQWKPQQPLFQYQFVAENDGEPEEEDEDEDDDEVDDEQLEVRERKPAAPAPAPFPVAASAPPLRDLGEKPPGPPPAPQPIWTSHPEAPSSTTSPFSPSASDFSPPEGKGKDPPRSAPPPPPHREEPRAPAVPPRSAPLPPKREEPPAATAAKKGAASGSPDETPFALPVASDPLMHSSAVVDLLYWRDVKKTGAVFGSGLFLLLSLTVFSIVSVVAYIALVLLSVTISFRIYKGVIQAIQKSEEGHPFRAYLDKDVAVSEELVQKYSHMVLGHFNNTVKELRRLFLVDDLVDSLKFAVLMWVFTYVGALFNGLTLLILALISLFSVPIIYEKHQVQIDHYLGLVNKNVKDAVAKIQAKIPGLKRKAE